MKKKNMSLKNITPKSMSCAALGCPSIYEAKDDSYVIIGSLASKSLIKELRNAISEGEAVIEVPKKLFTGLKDYQN